MQTISRRAFLAAAIAGLAAVTARADEARRRFNVLHIMSDDLAACLGSYGHPMVQTPRLDAFAREGVRFDRAYCQYPLCNPSRASYMTGLRSDTIQVYNNQAVFRDAVPDAVSLPQTFRNGGYRAQRVGKIYHYGVPAQIGTDGHDDPASWEKVVNPRGRDMDDIAIVEVLQRNAQGEAVVETGKQLTDTGGTLSWLAAEGTDAEQTDGIGAAEAIKLLEAHAASKEPFYLAVGFYRPHTPFVAPKAYFDRYPLESIDPEAVPDNLAELFPASALASQRPAEVAMDDGLKRKALQAYYASTTFMDAQFGLVLDALERLNLRDDTIVVFHSDHGYHLGDKNLWQKMTLFEEAARVPMIISVPGNAANGKSCTRPVELVSLHKTLADLCGLPVDAKVQGHSLRPLVENPGAEWEHPAYTQLARNLRPTRLGEPDPNPDRPKMYHGRSVRTQRWRYTEWDDADNSAELYDHDADPREMRNLANDPAHAAERERLKALLRHGGA